MTDGEAESWRPAVGKGLIIGSLGLLYFGLVCDMLYYRAEIHFQVPMLGEKTAELTGERALFGHSGAEDGIVPQLWKSGSGKFPAVVIAFVGLVLPVVKAALAFYPSTWGLVWARRLGRWALADAFAEALVVALLIASGVEAEHRLGYVCFILYSFSSNVGLLLIEEKEKDEEHSEQPLEAALARTVVPMFAICFAAFFVAGLSTNLVELSISEEAILDAVEHKVQDYGSEAQLYASMLGKKVSDLVHDIADTVSPIRGSTSLRSAILTLLQNKHWCSVVGSAFLLLPLIAIPVADVGLALYGLYRPQPGLERARRVIRDFAFLDVFVAGICIACMMSKNVHQLTARPRAGLFLLAFAAACEWGVDHFTPKRAKPIKSLV